MKSTSITMRNLLSLAVVFSALRVQAHIAAWHAGMYCQNGVLGTDDPSNNDVVNPLFNLTFSDWWFHHNNGCDQFPPPEGEFLELPANGQFTVELATNRAFTTLSFNGKFAGEFTGGNDSGERQANPGQPQDCITNPNIHTPNEANAAGTAFAISYQSDLTKVTQENLVVFSVLYNSPWRRIATYDVPNLPACPEEGCICAWGWVPNGCGQPNMYMHGLKCKVTGHTGNRAVAPGIPGTWCEDNQANCTTGARQMIYWHQLDGNNIETDGLDLEGAPRSPAYNTKLGFKNGAQIDIFADPGSATPTYMPPSPSSSQTPTSPPKGSAGVSFKDVASISWHLFITTILCAFGFCLV